DEPRVLFSSSHQYPYYPGTGSLTETGRGKAAGTKINVPLSAGVGDEGFKAIYAQVLIPLLRRFEPQLILVSAGYDAHWNDPLAQLGLTLTGMAWMSETLVGLAAELCGGKIVFTLEGGYNLNVLGHGVANSVSALLGRNNFADPIGPSPWPEPDLRDLIARLKQIHRLP
ncbi:MAG: histone deacetylase, partial [Anaerolineae bacterium]